MCPSTWFEGEGEVKVKHKFGEQVVDASLGDSIP